MTLLKNTVNKLKENWMIISIVLVAILVVASYILNFGGSFSNNQETWGQFGDYIGGVLNPLVAFLALIFLLKGIRLQTKEFKVVTDGMKKQNFEITFFQLLNSYERIISDTNIVKIEASDGKIESRASFSFLRSKLNEVMSDCTKEQEMLNKKYSLFYSDYEYALGHYFRATYYIVNFVETFSGFDEDYQKFYVNLLRARLSVDELILMFYNATSNLVETRIDEKNKFRPLIKKYNLLKHLRDEDIPQHHRCFISELQS